MSGLRSVLKHARGAARLAWLQEHGTDLPGAFGDISEVQRVELDVARLQMIRIGLYTATYEARTCRWGIRRILSASRGERTPTYRDCAAQRYRS